METDREELVSGTVLGRRTFLKGALGAAAVAAGGGLLSACSGGSSTSSATSSSAGAFGGTPKRGGTLRFATWSEIDGMDPSFNRWDQTGYAYARAVYDPLADPWTAAQRELPRRSPTGRHGSSR
jgi:ABC-type transport system substrate-binding protein